MELVWLALSIVLLVKKLSFNYRVVGFKYKNHGFLIN